jgi:hypothetical protein
MSDRTRRPPRKRQERLERDVIALAGLTPAGRVSRSLEEKARTGWPVGPGERIPDNEDGPAGGEDG